MSSRIGEIRPAQLITTYGPGSILDAKMDSLTVLDLKYWDYYGEIIRDPRLAAFLGVSHFRKPRTSDGWDLPVVSFPNYHVCSRCNLLFDIREGLNVSEYVRFGPRCPRPECQGAAYPTRFVISCERNHLDDFPWKWWVHGGGACDGRMRIETGGYTSSLADIIVKCSCGQERYMRGATDPENFREFRCRGKHPYRPADRDERCDRAVIPLQRGASNVYFPVLRSALSIPPWINPVDELLDSHYDDIQTILENGGNLDRMFQRYFSDRFTREQFDEALERRSRDIDRYSEIKEMEYASIIHHEDHDSSVERIFKAEEENVSLPLREYFSRVIKIHRLREIMVQLGFVRNSMPEPEVRNPGEIVWLDSGNPGRRWLPAVDINGEGIFIEFNSAQLEAWKSNLERLGSRLSSTYGRLYREWVEQKGWTYTGTRDAIYVMMHTFAHLLIKGLSDECGYSSSALKERIYYSEDMRMHGILIYTGASDREGTLGGLVEMGRMDRFVPLIRKIIENSLFCTNDPMCSTILPGEGSLNGSACHSCCMISETSCEMMNLLLDRSLVATLPEREERGYFEGLI